MTSNVAVLRPEPGNAATAARVEALGLETIRLPLFAVQPLDWHVPDPAHHDALILTSANAIHFGGPGLAGLRHLPVIAVGPKTAEIARKMGFDVMMTGDGDAASLLSLAREHGIARALHLAGRHRSIQADGAVSRTIAVYTSEAVPISAEQLLTLQGSIALLHSTRAAQRLGELVDLHALPRAAIGIAALSPAVAAAAGPCWATIAIAPAPADSALIAVLQRTRD